MATQPTVRFFCYADASDLGIFALSYCDAMVHLGIPVRLLATRAAQMHVFADLGGRGMGWTRHRGLFLTPIDHACYVNMVCGDAMDQRRLYTVGTTNVLLTMFGPYPDAEDTRAAVQYERIICPTADLAHAWKAVGGNPVVVPLDWADAELTLRAAVTP